MLPINAMASEATYESNTDCVVVDDGNIRTAVASDNTAEYTVSFDRTNSTLTVSVRNLQSDEIQSVTITAEDTSSDVPARLQIERTTVAKFKYMIWTDSTYSWFLERPKLSDEGTGTYYFACYENKSNTEYLRVYKNAVDEMKILETELYAKEAAKISQLFISGLSAIYSIKTGGLISASALTVLMESLDIIGEAAVAAEKVNIGFSNCLLAIEDVFYNTDNTFYPEYV